MPARPSGSLTRRGYVVNPSSMSSAGPQNVILNGKSAFYTSGEYAGALSIKWMARGSAIYEITGGRFAVGSDNYLILNDGQTYAMTIDSETPVESFCVFFHPDFARDA